MGNFNYTYDANDDLQRKTDTTTNDRTDHQYAGLGNLVQVKRHEGTSNERVTNYKVDGLGRRVQKRMDDGQM